MSGIQCIVSGVVALMLANVAAAADDARSPFLTTRQFAFHSDLATNLNDALIVAGTARNAGEAELFREGPHRSCFDELAPSLRAGWDRAVDYYAEIVSPVDWGDRQQFLLRLDLARIDDDRDARAERFVDMARSFRSVAMPAYEACRWPAQDAANRAWIEALADDLEHHEAAIAKRLEVLYATPWHGLPIIVDIVQTAPSKGANSFILSPAGGHVLAGSASVGERALEIVFHEASHTLTAPWRGDPLPKALEDAAEALDVPLPRDLWHVVMFYVTGQTVREVLAAAGRTDYEPYVYAENLWTGRWGSYREAIESVLPAYLEGGASLESTAAYLLKGIAAGRQSRDASGSAGG